MIRNLKILGLAMVAMLAMSAMAAAAAQAESPEFHAEEAPVTYEGEAVEKTTFAVEGGTVSCGKTTYAGSSSTTTTSEINLEVAFAECTAFGEATVWDINGCTFPSTLVLGSQNTTVTDIVCPAGKEVTITIGKKCVMHVPPQKGIKHVVWDNVGSGKTRDYRATMTEEGIKYTATSGCLFPGTGSGVYNSTATIKGKNAKGEQEGIWVE